MKPTTPDMTVATIRALYPHPVECCAETKGATGFYCVGGALIDYYGVLDDYEGVGHRTFPPDCVLAEALMKINPELTYQDALGFGVAITEYNDARDFDAAWDAANHALSWRSDEADNA